ncbi:hypothetical protein [Bradyrhizobium retamae]|nr:hypothetical protein [Bradyrhizobium retamae]
MSAYPFATRFMLTKGCQCMYFLPGESGMAGLVCGAPTRAGKSFCDAHRRETYQPLKAGRIYFRDASVVTCDDDSDHEPDLTEIVS